MTGTRLYVLAVIEHASRRIRILGATPHRAASWAAQAAKNNARPLRALPLRIPEPAASARLHVRRRDRLGGILHEYQHAA